MARDKSLESAALRARHAAARLLSQPVALFEMFHRRPVSAKNGGVVDCVEGAKVRLLKESQVVAETASDNYGDFKFDRLDENSGLYSVEVSINDETKKVIETKLGGSINVGEIRI